MSLLASVTFCSVCAFAPHAPAQSLPRENDAWSDEITWRTADGWYATAVHATLLPDGRVHAIGFDRDTQEPEHDSQTRRSAFVMTPQPPDQPVPEEVVVQSLIEPVDADMTIVPPYIVNDDLFCTGQTLTADGAVFTAGGTRAIINTATGEFAMVGLSYATVFDGANWFRVPADMVVAANMETPARWYPTVTRLPDRRLLVTSGYDSVLPYTMENRSAEVFDPATGSWSVVSPPGAPPSEITNPDYTHVVVLPSPWFTFDLLAFGAAGKPVYLSMAGPQTWSLLPIPRPGTAPGEMPNHGATTALLPIRVPDGEWGYRNGTTLVAGGAHGSVHEHSVDAFDPIDIKWLPKVDTKVPRHHPTAVLLPDGRVLLVAGHDEDGDPNVRRNTYIDPKHGLAPSIGQAASEEVRGYHHVALLLPDGRVLIGGGRDVETDKSVEKTTFRYYYPPYMFRERPRILKAPAAISYDDLVIVESAGPRPFEVVLVALGSMTHSFDFNQRHVELGVFSVAPNPSAPGFVVVATPPKDERTAPPGYYMLFVLDEKRTPSIARIVKLG